MFSCFLKRSTAGTPRGSWTSERFEFQEIMLVVEIDILLDCAPPPPDAEKFFEDMWVTGLRNPWVCGFKFNL